MANLIITRGLPGSGKTTFAKGWLRQDREHRARVNRDDIRLMFHGGGLYGSDMMGASENSVSDVQRTAVESLLRREFDVIVDDTNLPESRVSGWRGVAARGGHGIIIKDFRDVSLIECIARQSGRPESEQVPEDVIRGMHEKYIERVN